MSRRSVLWSAGAILVLCLLGYGLANRVWDRSYWLSRADLLSLDRETQEHPQDKRAWYYLGRRLLEKGRPGDAVRALEQASALDAADVPVRIALARAYLNGGDFNSAFQILKTLEAGSDGEPEVHELLGTIYEKRGAYHKAAQQWERLLVLRPGDANGYRGRGYALLSMQQVQEAEAVVEKGLARSPKDFELLRLRGAIAAAVGDAAKARAMYQRAIEVHPRDPVAYNDYASFLLSSPENAEDLKQAENAVARLKELAPGHPLMLWHSARLALRKQQWQQAAEQLQQAVVEQPSLHEAYFELSRAYGRMGNEGKSEAALARYQHLVELKRRIEELRIRIGEQPRADLYFELARLQQAAGLRKEARSSVTLGLRLDPNSRKGLATARQLEAPPGSGR